MGYGLLLAALLLGAASSSDGLDIGWGTVAGGRETFVDLGWRAGEGR